MRRGTGRRRLAQSLPGQLWKGAVGGRAGFRDRTAGYASGPLARQAPAAWGAGTWKPMNFDLSPEIRDLRDRVRAFIAEQVMPFEADERCGAHGPSASLRIEWVGRAREAGLLTPHASIAMGGIGLNHVAKAVVFEEAGYSWLG